MNTQSTTKTQPTHLMSLSSIVSDDDSVMTSSTSKKEVRFAKQKKLHIYERSTSDPTSSWFNAEDFSQFRLDRSNDAAKMRGRHPNELDQDTECFWGLENVIVTDLRQRTLQTRRAIAQDVLSAQEEQWKERRLNPHKIYRASRTHSEWSASVARKKALFYASQNSIEI